MPGGVSLSWAVGQGFGLIALALCMLDFASRQDDRLFVLLLFANVAFASQFALLGSGVAAAIAALIVLRIHLVRRYPGQAGVMLAMVGATVLATAVIWNGPRDLWALAAGVIGTYGMFMHDGIGMRWLLAIAAFCWVVSNLLVGSIGGTLAETLILVTNLVTIGRLYRDRQYVRPAEDS